MAHLEKFTTADSGRMMEHYDRTKPSLGDHIDKSRTAQNYNLAQELQPLPQEEFLRARLAKVAHANRKDLVAFCDVVLTLPQGEEAIEREFFKTSFEFLCKRFGQENVISAYVHKDEVQPHMHFAFTPVIEDERGKRFCAKKVCERRQFQTLHTDLSNALVKHFGRDVGVVNGATVDGNRTIEQLKRVNEKYEAQRRFLEAADEQALHTAKGDVEGKIKRKAVGFGKKRRKVVVLPEELYNALARSALTNAPARAAASAAIRTMKQSEEAAASAAEEVKQAKKAQRFAEGANRGLQRENAELKKANEELRGVVAACTEATESLPPTAKATWTQAFATAKKRQNPRGWQM